MARKEPFPSDPRDFGDDYRISWDTEENKWLLVDEDKEEWEYSGVSGNWYQPATEEHIAQFQQAYGAAENDDDHEAYAAAVDKKRKKTRTEEDSKKKPRTQENRGVYVTGLPLDTNAEEIAKEFSKWGMIDQGVDGSKRVKVYADENGNFNGEALIIYFVRESVFSAIQMLHNSWFRPGDPDRIQVQEADLSYKKHQDAKEVKQVLVRKDRKASELQRQQLKEKLADWSDEDEVSTQTFKTTTKNKFANIVIIKFAFTLKELAEDPAAYSDIKEDFREEGEKFGVVTSVTICDKEPEGIVLVKFKEEQEAAAFAAKNNGRHFSGQALQISIAQDRPKFARSGKGTASDEEEEADLLDKVAA